MEQLTAALHIALANTFVMYFKSHSYHWNIEGTNFPQYHSFLDGFYNQVWEQTDDIAEHLRKLDSYAPGSFTRFLELSDIQDEVNVPTALIMMNTLRTDNDRLIMHLRAGIVAADQANEPAVSNFLQDLLGRQQKSAWMLRSILK